MKKIWEELEQTIKEKYHISGQEWVQVDISSRGKIHTTIVSDSHILKSELRSLIETTIAEYQEEYRIGFIDIYSIEKAEEYRIEKTSKKSGYATWTDALYAHEKENTPYSDMQIISFYSYKGGVGRTIALIETAYNLAKAGKRILLLDLDIEAPSLHNIFADIVNHPTNGIEYGVVEYLYRKTVQKQEDISVDQIFCPLELQNIPGEIYLIPALKKMNKEYIYQIERLQTLQLQEQDTFNEIFHFVKTVLNVDTIMIDTRAGFNKWGSLSLLTLSDQVIFIAYANSENIEGLNTAFELLHNVGKKRYAVAMSKVVPSEEGVSKAEALFSALNIPQNQLIPIFYKEEIALNSQYPITAQNALEAYHELSKYILDNDRISRNRAYLANGMKQQLLGNLFLPQKQLVTLADVTNFRIQRASAILKYTYPEELYGLKSEIRHRFVTIDQALVPVPMYIFTGIENEAHYESLLTEKWEDIEKAGIQLLNLVIADSDSKEKDIIPTGKKELNEILACLKRKNSSKDIIMFNNDDIPQNSQEYETISELRIIVSVSDNILTQNAVQVIENIKNLIAKFNHDIKKIHFKFLVNAAVWDKCRELTTGLKGNIQEVTVCREDIRRFLMLNLNLAQLNPYKDYINSIRTVSSEGEVVFHFHNVPVSQTEMNEIIGLVLGIRQNVRVYSSSVMEYLVRKLQANPHWRYDCLLDALKSAAEKELLHMDETYSDRLLPYNKLQAELDTL